MANEYEVATRRLTFWKPDNAAMFSAMGRAGWQLVSVVERTCYFQRGVDRPGVPDREDTK